MSDDTFEKISKIGKVEDKIVDPSAKIDSGPAAPSDAIAANKDNFDAFMHRPVDKAPEQLEGPEKLRNNQKRQSFIDEVSQLSSKIETSGFNAKDKSSRIRNIRENTNASLKTVKGARSRLEAPNIEIKKTFETPLKNKLSSIQNRLGSISKTAGIEDLKRASEIEKPGRGSPLDSLPQPVKRFVTLLTEGQSQLESLDQELTNVGSKELSPTALLSIQVKMGHLTHELELFSSLLNKALEGTKTIMNVQV